MRTKDQAVAAYNFLTVAEVAEQLKVSRSHVAALIRSGALSAIDVGAGERREYRIAPDEFAAFVERRRVA